MPKNNPSKHTFDWPNADRKSSFDHWLNSLVGTFSLDESTLTLASSDASFRRYFRIFSMAPDSRSYIIMDAPPDKENCTPFVVIAKLMGNAGILVPEILNWNEPHGFMLITDLGHQTLLEKLSLDLDLNDLQSVPPVEPFKKALDALLLWQKATTADGLPAYDESVLTRELDLFSEWYLNKHMAVSLTLDQQNSLSSIFSFIVKSNLSAPKVFVHRDFMTRNLMIPKEENEYRLGVLDFQDALLGPITYDIASLMRDAFCSWSEEFVLDITVRYWERIRLTGLIDQNGWSEDFGEFWRAVELMGLQRHLKVAGIFARLTIRDQKPKYLADTPRFINYIRKTSERYRELFPLIRLLDSLENKKPENMFSFGRI